jgi:hypothetical protein
MNLAHTLHQTYELCKNLPSIFYCQVKMLHTSEKLQSPSEERGLNSGGKEDVLEQQLGLAPV